MGLATLVQVHFLLIYTSCKQERRGWAGLGSTSPPCLARQTQCISSPSPSQNAHYMARPDRFNTMALETNSPEIKVNLAVTLTVCMGWLTGVEQRPLPPHDLWILEGRGTPHLHCKLPDISVLPSCSTQRY